MTAPPIPVHWYETEGGEISSRLKTWWQSLTAAEKFDPIPNTNLGSRRDMFARSGIMRDFLRSVGDY